MVKNKKINVRVENTEAGGGYSIMVEGQDLKENEEVFNRVFKKLWEAGNKVDEKKDVV